MIVGQLLLSLTIAFGAAIAYAAALRLRPEQGGGILVGSVIVILLAPLVVPSQATLARFLASVCSLLIGMKIYDLNLDAGRTSRLGWGALVAFLPNWSSMVLRRLASEPRPSQRDNWVRLARGMAGLGPSVAILGWLFRVEWSRQSFAIEHSAKVVALFFALIPAGAVSICLWRLAGGQTRDWFDAFLLARTPADFWRRYNRPVQQFFFEDVFKRVGGFRSPARATLLTFAISGLVHEYVFALATGRVRGYQLTFFLIHGCAVAATLRVRPKAWRAIAWIGATWVFNLASSVFFFANLNGIVPFYSRELPAWLKW